MIRTHLGLILASSLFLFSCGSASDTINSTDEMSQQVGDTMSAIDSSGGSSGALAFMKMSPEFWQKHFPGQKSLIDRLIPAAYADSCRAAGTFGSCTENVVTRTFDNCSIGTGIFSGTVTFDFHDAAIDDTCKMASSGDSVSRDPEFTITGLHGGIFSVTKTGTVGQKVTKTGDSSYEFSNDGIQRIFKNAKGTTVTDFTAKTTENLGITGTVRKSRVVDGGTLEVTNNLTSVTCSITPNSVTYDSTCNCAVSGSWAGTCTDADAVDVEITACGKATITKGSNVRNLTFDRCYSTSAS